MPRRREKEVTVRVMGNLGPPGGRVAMAVNTRMETVCAQYLANHTPPCTGIVCHGQLLEMGATLEGLGIQDEDPRSLTVVGEDCANDHALNNCGCTPSTLIGGFTLEDYPRLIASEDIYLKELSRKGTSLIPPDIYEVVGDDVGVLVHGEGLYHLTYEAQTRCSGQLKTLLKTFSKGYNRATSIPQLPCKMPDFSEVIGKKLRNPRHYKHAFQFIDDIQSIVHKYHNLSLSLLGQIPKDDDEMERITIEYDKMQQVLTQLFEPGVLFRGEGDELGQVVITDPEVTACCKIEDRCMPGCDDNIYYVGPTRNMKPSGVGRDNALVVRLQGITPTTTVGDLVMCYKIVLDNVSMNITHLKYNEKIYKFTDLVHDAINTPNLGLKKFYFSYLEHDAEKMDIDELVQFIGGEEEKPDPLKAEGKKKKKQKKKSKADGMSAQKAELDSLYVNMRSIATKINHLSSGVESLTELSGRRSKTVSISGSIGGSIGGSVGADSVEDVSPSPEPLDLSALGAHGHTSSEVVLPWDVDTPGTDAILEMSETVRKTSEAMLEHRASFMKSNDVLLEDKNSLEAMLEDRSSFMDMITTPLPPDFSQIVDENILRILSYSEPISHGEEIHGHMATLENPIADLARQAEEILKLGNWLEKSERDSEVIELKEELEKKEKEAEEVRRSMEQMIEEKGELREELDKKEQEAEKFRRSMELMIAEKGKEMTNLITSQEQLEDLQAHRQKKIAGIEEDIKQLQAEVSSIKKECQETVVDISKVEKKRTKLGGFLDTYTTDAKQNAAKLQQEIESLKAQIRKPKQSPVTQPIQIAPEAPPQANVQLLQFIDRQIDALKQELECPVCFVVATNPIFKCEDDHLICSICRPKMTQCPQCRANYQGGPKRFRGAERQADKLADLYRERENVQ